MKEVYHISGAGNSSGLKIFESHDNTLIIKVPKPLISRSWRFLIIGILALVASILIPLFTSMYIASFWIKAGFFFFSLAALALGGGVATIATWEIRSAIEITIDHQNLKIVHPAFFKYRSLTRNYKLITIDHLYVNKVRRIGREKYSLMLKNKEPLDERLIKGFYVPEQALWIAQEINDRIKKG